MKITITVSALVLSLFIAGESIADPVAIDEWQKHVKWSTENTGVPNCEGMYMAANMNHCLAAGVSAYAGRDPPRWVGNRSCVMASAIGNAHAGNCGGAFGLTLLTQCHNGAAQTQLQQAGPDRVCEFLKLYSVVPQF
ncbi:hypothetical protein [Rhizobium leguminosarum]|uniref:hypothetical protein n=1 Tax=Rhizobium leguminosarum TaxID=384 RepID=UPI001C943A81|nr:hypothetical protein [Rhizobium leguminosarum]MBY5698504.1 hypothetical protein [Rhizobium leguminosarum]